MVLHDGSGLSLRGHIQASPLTRRESSGKSSASLYTTSSSSSSSSLAVGRLGGALPANRAVAGPRSLCTPRAF